MQGSHNLVESCCHCKNSGTGADSRQRDILSAGRRDQFPYICGSHVWGMETRATGFVGPPPWVILTRSKAGQPVVTPTPRRRQQPPAGDREE